MNLRVEPGEAVGLIGINGSGKSTLLKILTRVMYPHSGQVDVAGRVGALIEVRAGIHPDLSGRENVYLYGSLLGLRRSAISARFDEIVEFAEIAEAIDRQVKFYSSGMQMRLGFAVAAFLEPNILLVDEILAVGDASFQQRCLERMRVVLSQGTTLVFVSHDLAAVEAVCTRGLWLQDAKVRMDGPLRDVLSGYRRAIEETAELALTRDSIVRVTKVEFLAESGPYPKTQELVEIVLGLESQIRRSSRIILGVSEGPGTPIFLLRETAGLEVGGTVVRCTIPHLPLPRGRYYLWAGIFGDREVSRLLPWHPIAHFDVIGPELEPSPTGILRLSPVHVGATWRIESGD